MRTTKGIKMAIALATTTLFTTASIAQETKNNKNYDQGFRLGLGLIGGYATNNPYKLALGGDVRLQYDLTKRYSLTLTTGYSNLFVSKSDGSDLGFIPVKLGFKGFVWNDQFYIMGEVGSAFSVTNDYHQTSLLLAPSIGYATKYIDISVRYEQYSNFERLNNDGSTSKGVGQIGVRLAYGFKL